MVFVRNTLRAYKTIILRPSKSNKHWNEIFYNGLKHIGRITCGWLTNLNAWFTSSFPPQSVQFISNRYQRSFVRLNCKRRTILGKYNVRFCHRSVSCILNFFILTTLFQYFTKRIWSTLNIKCNIKYTNWTQVVCVHTRLHFLSKCPALLSTNLFWNTKV